MNFAGFVLIVFVAPILGHADSCVNGSAGTLRLEYYDVKVNDVNFGLDEGYGATNFTMALRSPKSALAVVANYSTPCATGSASIIDAVQTSYATQAPKPVLQEFVLLAVTSTEHARAALEQCQRTLNEAKQLGKNVLVMKDAERLGSNFCEIAK